MNACAALIYASCNWKSPPRKIPIAPKPLFSLSADFAATHPENWSDLALPSDMQTFNADLKELARRGGKLKVFISF